MKLGHVDLEEQCFIIAELSANHNGSLETAIETIKAAKRAGANAIKLQTYTADTVTLDCKKDDFKISGTIWEGQYLHDLYSSAYTPWEWHEKLFRVAREEGLECFSSPFDFSAIDFLKQFDPIAYKIASFEITDIDLIRKVAETQKTIILSSGIASKEDIDLAVKTIRSTGNNNIVILKCTSAYPAPMEEVNLAMIPRFSKDYGVVSGLSDHTKGIEVPIAAVTLGARVIEKHFILDESVGGPDASFSLTEKEFTEMVKSVRNTEKAIGYESYEVSERSKKGRAFSRSLYFSQNVKKGEVASKENVRSVRPGFGLAPKYLNDIIGKKLKHDVEKGDRVSFDNFLD